MITYKDIQFLFGKKRYNGKKLAADNAEGWVSHLLEDTTHFLHGVVQANWYGHLLQANGRESGSCVLSGFHIMDLWHRLCKYLGVRKISVMDVLKKYGLEYSLLDAITNGHPWYGDRGYVFGAGSFALTLSTYRRAVETLSIAAIRSPVRMKTSILGMMIFAVIVSRLMLASALQSTVPAVMWSPYLDKRMEEEVNYQTISPKALARSVLSEGGWSSLLCAGKHSRVLLDIAFVFIGKELQSLDISGTSLAKERELVDILKVSFMSSNFSMAFPYVALEKQGSMENSLLAEFSDACDRELRVSNVQLMGSCSIEGKGYEKLVELGSLHDYFATRMEKEINGLPDLIVYCHKGLDDVRRPEQMNSESDVFSYLINSLEKSGARYAVLYVSDPYESGHYPSSLPIERFLMEASSANRSVNSTICDGVCQIKTSLLEGILVVSMLITLLPID
ncbi:hypothetical protein Ancab_016017 [Ancistrocladus abbreviatus]